MSSAGSPASDGVRLLSPRPSILFRVAHLADDPSSDVGEGVILAGPDWQDRLKEALLGLTAGEAASLYAAPLNDAHAIPLLAAKALQRARTDWFPEFLFQGHMRPHFQVIVDLATGAALGREALMRGKLGRLEVRGAELMAAAEAHDALFSFDARARIAAIEHGYPLLPAGEILFVKLDPRAILDLESSIRSTWPVLERAEGDPARLCLELVHPERCADIGLLSALVAAHREHGALIALDDLSGGAGSLACLEATRPAFAKLDHAITTGIETSDSRRHLIGAVVEIAHEAGVKVVAEGVERVGEYETMRDLGVDYGQGFYFGQPTEKPLPVDPRLFQRELV